MILNLLPNNNQKKEEQIKEKLYYLLHWYNTESINDFSLYKVVIIKED